MASIFERQKAFRERIRISAECEEFEKFKRANACCSTTTDDERYAMFLSTRETVMFEERMRKFGEAACEKQQNHNMLSDFETVGDKLNLDKLAESKKKKWRKTASKKYKRRNKPLRNKIRVIPKRSVVPRLRRQSRDVIAVKFIKGQFSSQLLKKIQLDVPQKLKSEQDIRDAPINGESSREQLPDDDVTKFQVCHIV